MTKKKILTAVFLYIGLLLFSLWVIGFCAFCVYAFSFKFQPAEKTDAIVVLTGGGERVQTALTLLSEGYANHLLISGVNESVKRSELIQALSPALSGRVTLGYLAKNTRGNAVEAVDFMRRHQLNSLLLVTSFYHMPRSVFEILSVDPTLKIKPLPVFPKSFNDSVDWIRTRYAWLLFVEYHKFVATHLQHTMERIWL